VLRALDAAIPAIPLAQAFGRWGNYFNQELFGTPTTVPWALEVDPEHRPERYADAATFHPTFLYESLWNLAVVGILLRVSATRRLRPGSLSLLYLLLYGAGRFGLELLRTDTTYRLLGLSRNGWISLAVVTGASVWLWRRERRRPAPEAAAGPDDPGEAGGDDAEERQWSS
jgi:prolipoprotein diacylglyceryl transferase